MKSKRSKRRTSDLDNPWKEALEHFLPSFLAFFFPRMHDDIDWRRKYKSLDKELQKILPDARTGHRLADKLFQVWLKDGSEVWLLIHIEIQGQKDTQFTERMFIYNYRSYDRYRRRVISLAILTDDDPKWSPNHFAYEGWDFQMRMQFPTVKLLDYRARAEELESDPSPFAAVVLAHLKVLETRELPKERQRWKLRLIKGLYDRGLTAEDIYQLFRLLDWMVQLPVELEEQFQEELQRFEEEKAMPYVTSIERRAIEKGRQEGHQEGRQEGLAKGLQEGLAKGLQEGIASILDVKFGERGKKLLGSIKKCQDVDKLRALTQAIKNAANLDEIKPLLS